jgi:hypothetical protein
MEGDHRDARRHQPDTERSERAGVAHRGREVRGHAHEGGRTTLDRASSIDVMAQRRLGPFIGSLALADIEEHLADEDLSPAATAASAPARQRCAGCGWNGPG